MVLKGRAPNKAEKEWMDSISQLGCIVCLHFFGAGSPAEIHHISGKTSAGCHFQTLPLCFKHHREGIDNDLYTSRHPFKAKFIERYGTEESLLELTKKYLGEKCT